MSDTYDNMSDEGLRRVIAERLGYTVQGQQYNNNSDMFYYLLGPDGKPYFEGDARMQAMIGGKQYTIREYDDMETPWLTTPDWPGSTDTALGLFPKGPEFALLCVRDQYNFVYGNGFEGVYDTVENRVVMPGNWDWHDTPARAICIAWLRWHNAGHGGA